MILRALEETGQDKRKRRPAARDQPEDALQQAGEVRHPGGEVGASHADAGGGRPATAGAAARDLGRILHDLRGPANSLTMHVEVLKRTARGDSGAEESLRNALEQLGRLAEMVPAAFDVTALELGPLRTVDLGALGRCACRTPRAPPA